MSTNLQAKWLEESAAAFGAVLEATGVIRANCVRITSGPVDPDPYSPFRASPIADNEIRVNSPADLNGLVAEAQAVVRLDALDLTDDVAVDLLAQLANVAGRRLAVLVPANAVTAPTGAAARVTLSAAWAVEWLVFFSWSTTRPAPRMPQLPLPMIVRQPRSQKAAPTESAPPAPPPLVAAPFVLLIATRSGSQRGRVSAIDLRGLPPESWEDQFSEPKAAEAGRRRLTCMRKRAFDGPSWRFESFHPAVQAMRRRVEREDFQSMSEIVAEFRVGEHEAPARPWMPRMRARSDTQLRRKGIGGGGRGTTRLVPYAHCDLLPEEPDDPDDGVEDGAENDPSLVWLHKLRTEDTARAGDVIVSRYPRESGALDATEVAQLVGLHRDVVGLRFKEGVDSTTKQVLVAYLRSQQAGLWLRDHGYRLTQTDDSGGLATLLMLMPVPRLAPGEIDRALHSITDALETYSTWSDELASKKDELFIAPFTAGKFEEVLDVARVHSHRIAVAEESETLAWIVRTAYPRPVAVRYELIDIHPRPRDRLDEVLYCAEYLIHLLALMASIQQGGKPARNTRTDWGSAYDEIRSGVKFTRRPMDAREVGTLPIADLKLLTEPLTDDSPWCQAHERLRTQRNKRSHGRQLYDADATARLDEWKTDLHMLFAPCNFLQKWPLVYVAAYDRVVGFDSGTVHLYELAGAWAVPKAHRLPVTADFRHGDVAFWGKEEGHFHSTHPWLVSGQALGLHETGQQREPIPSLWLFSRLEDAGATYVNMETGEEITNAALEGHIRRLSDDTEEQDED